MRLHIGLPGPFSVSVGGHHHRRTPAQRRAERARTNRQLVAMSTGAYVTVFAIMFALSGALFFVHWVIGLMFLAVTLYKLIVTHSRRPAPGLTAPDQPSP